jgi:hypothetical protein
MPFSILSTLARFDLASEEVKDSSSLFSILSSWTDNIGDKRGIRYLPLFENRRAILRWYRAVRTKYNIERFGFTSLK